MSCLFCKIVDKQIPAKIAHEDEDTLAFHDINPVAPTHVLVIPKKHIATIADAAQEDQALLGKLLLVAGRIATAEGHTAEGFRTVINAGRNAGQTVFHIHVHVIGGRAMGWPPG